MLAKKLVLGVAIIIASLMLIGTTLPTSSVWAATILCQPSPAQCNGTNDGDTMVGDSEQNIMLGKAGNDVMTGKGGNDLLFGFSGDDVLSGGTGNDDICAGIGADRIAGGDGNDLISHNGCDPTPPLTDPDGSKDVIDCGLGDDEVSINVSVDHDTASGCEIVHAG
jgi:Ca2+-binding RTX toxin-like protein